MFKGNEFKLLYLIYEKGKITREDQDIYNTTQFYSIINELMDLKIVQRRDISDNGIRKFSYRLSIRGEAFVNILLGRDWL